MHAILKRPIWIGDSYFAKGVFNESNPKTKMLFKKDWFLESLEKDGYLELHRDAIKEENDLVDSAAPEKEIATLEVKPPKPPKGKKADK